ncbi:ABC transporter permease [Rhodococcus pyridinivorans]|uniref:ABC transporter permease n=1 Tax=Rhodococcus pyridinivorans TaxID=103816 RepID=UPI002283C746|nr:ABC transporter permease [Rhodococcus pyridinivorans]WAL49781.1 ABC transporter permease [Rhodococcus pyridinivorans]
MSGTQTRPSATGDVLRLLGRFMADYVRNPVNLLVLVVVPGVFVIVAAGSIAEAARLLGGSGGPAVEAATAGWAAGFLAGIAMYYQVNAARAADRRLVLAGLAPWRLVAARLGTGLVLAAVATVVALLALVLRSGIEAPMRVVVGTVMFAVIYLAIGALVGALVRSPVNGTVLILFVWIIDVFFGPAVGSPDRLTTRWLPTHFVTLWMVDTPSRHGGRLGDLGWALVWLGTALIFSVAVITATAGRARRSSRRDRSVSSWNRFVVGLRMGLRDWRRNPVLWVLLVAVPLVFIVLAKATTAPEFGMFTLVEGGRTVTAVFWLPEVHAGTMTPIAIASLSALAGLFLGLDARRGDRRLVGAGFEAAVLLASRLAVLAVAVAVVTVSSLAVTAAVFEARQWGLYAAGNLLLALTYGLVGVCLGPIFGRVGGVFVAFLVPFVDLGIGQSPMLRPQPPRWAQPLPGYGPVRVVLDGGLTVGFDTTTPVLVALAWLIALTVMAGWLLRRAPVPAVHSALGT